MTTSSILIRESDDLILRLESQAVSRCYLDYAFGVQFFESDPEITIRIGCQFEFYDRGERFLASPELTETIGRVLRIFGKRVSLAKIRKADGTLEIDFENDARIKVHPDPLYEAWEIVGENNELIVCTPGGEVVTWSEKPA